VVWSSDCQSNNVPCSESPLLLDCSFTATNDLLQQKTKVIAGYNVTGQMVNEKMIIGDSTIFMTVLSGENVSNNYWSQYIVSGSYGVLGFGPGSILWSSYLQSANDSVSYSI